MPKHPQWFYKSYTKVAHTGQSLRDAAKVIEADARRISALGMKSEAAAGRIIATALIEVSHGATWADAFGLPRQQEKE